MKYFIAALWCVWAQVAFAQTYFGVLTTPANSGPGGSCCSSTPMVSDASNQPVPPECTGCSVISQAQYQAYQDAASALGKAISSANLALASGLTLNCTGNSTSSWTGTYIVSNNLITFLQLAQFFTGAKLQTFIVVDTSGKPHSFANSAAATTITTAIGGYWMDLFSYAQGIAAGQSPTFPPSTSTAC